MLRTLCKILLLWVNYEYQKLPMGLCNSPYIFQERMNELFQDLDCVRLYIKDLIVLSNGTWEEHLANLINVLTKLINNGLKVNIDKYVFGQTKGNYPVTAGVYSNPGSAQFIHRLKPSLGTTIFSTVIGSGSSTINLVPTAFNIDDCLNILLSGWGGMV